MGARIEDDGGRMEMENHAALFMALIFPA